VLLAAFLIKAISQDNESLQNQKEIVLIPVMVKRMSDSTSSGSCLEAGDIFFGSAPLS
jgi:hypothetical protein